MAEHPIIYSTEMVRAILEGRKTQTRRIVKPQPLKYFPEGAASKHKPPHHVWWSFIYPTKHSSDTHCYIKCPYGQVGDRLWVRETWNWGKRYKSGHVCFIDNPGHNIPPIPEWAEIFYKAHNNLIVPHKWIPSIFMPRWAARIFLEITNIRVEQIQDIDAVEAEAEGIRRPKRLCPDRHDEYILERFQRLWDSLNFKRGYGWDKNPFVWVIEFKRA